MKIEVNNGCYLEIHLKQGKKDGGVIVESGDKNGVYRRDCFDDGEIVMTLNLLRYMRDNGFKSVSFNGEDFRIFQ